jgi:8-oxo-dGTP diphosphatase
MGAPAGSPEASPASDPGPGGVDARPLMDVAVGIVHRGSKVLLAQRPPGKPYAGWWEFPGGKLEPGETVGQALVRELNEELGLRIASTTAWVVRTHSYPHAHVRLHFRRIWDFQGEPSSREGQAFAWLEPGQVDVAPLLPATVPLLRWLTLPSRYGLSAASLMGVDAFLLALDRALAAGLRLVQLREKSMAPPHFDALFDQVLDRCRRAGARLLVNSDHPPPYWARADGVHLTSRALQKATVRPDLPLVAASCHGIEQIRLASQLGADFAVLGPVAATASHPDVQPLGWQAFGEVVQASGLPVYALGGLSLADEPAARIHGAHGLAMLRAAWQG